MKLALIGYGKMGKTIERLLIKEGHEVILIINSKNAEDLNKVNLKEVDVAIEFTNPEVAFNNIVTCLKNGVPVVSGSTGWLDREKEVREICKQNRGAFLYASNFSIGVNIFFALNEYLAKLMSGQKEFNVSIEEIHHTQKLDSPSGTAITLLEGIKKELNKDTIPINSIRTEGTPATHTVEYKSLVDTIQIKHIAHSREGFAKGAVMAANFLVGKEGVYGMGDMLKF